MTNQAWASSAPYNHQTPDGQALVLVSWGCVTPLGENALQSAFGFRAGASALGPCALLDDAGNTPTLASVATLDPYLEGDARLRPLIAMAVQEALGPVAHLINGRALSSYFLADEAQPMTPGNSFVDDLGLWARDQLRAVSDYPTRIAIHATGAAGLTGVLDAIRKEFQNGTAELAVIVSGHSDYERTWVQSLAQARRLHSPEQLDGMILSEMAACLLVCTQSMAGLLGLSPAVWIDTWHTATEKALWSNDESAYEALALTFAARHATEAHHNAGHKIGWLTTDASLESFKMAELQAVLARLQSRLGAPQQLDTPAHRIGHLGAAAGLWQAIYAAEAFKRQFAPSDAVLCLLGSDLGGRSALMLRRASA
jgi:3-oxoacyl-[acyl-carrier-protein] synthase I